MVQLYNCWIHPFTISLDGGTGGTSRTAAHIKTVKLCANLNETATGTQLNNAQAIGFNIQY